MNTPLPLKKGFSFYKETFAIRFFPFFIQKNPKNLFSVKIFSNFLKKDKHEHTHQKFFFEGILNGLKINRRININKYITLSHDHFFSGFKFFKKDKCKAKKNVLFFCRTFPKFSTIS